MLTEQISDIVARKQLRASKTQVIAATALAREKRQEMNLRQIGVLAEMRSELEARIIRLRGEAQKPRMLPQRRMDNPARIPYVTKTRERDGIKHQRQGQRLEQRRKRPRLYDDGEDDDSEGGELNPDEVEVLFRLMGIMEPPETEQIIETERDESEQIERRPEIYLQERSGGVPTIQHEVDVREQRALEEAIKASLSDRKDAPKKPKIPYPPRLGLFTCAICTFENANGATRCAMCGTERPESEDTGQGQQQQTPADWTCSVCTVINPGFVANCSCCENSRVVKKGIGKYPPPPPPAPSPAVPPADQLKPSARPPALQAPSLNCSRCGTPAKAKCTGCGSAFYCGEDCQHKDWPTHKKVCGKAPPDLN